MYVTFLQKKWYKGKHLVKGLYNHVIIGGNKLVGRKELKNSVGFLVHLSWTFPAVF